MKLRLIFIYSIFLILIILIPGCSHENEAWENANKKGTIEAYKIFINKYPTADNTKYAKLKIDSLEFARAKQINSLYAYLDFLKKYPSTKFKEIVNKLIRDIRQKRYKSLQAIKDIKLNLKLNFPHAENFEYKRNEISSRIWSMFKNVGINLIDDSTKTSAAILNIIINGKALLGSYSIGGGEIIPGTGGLFYCFTGAKITGGIHLVIGKSEIIKIPIYIKKKPTESVILGTHETPESAPFIETLESEFYKKISLFINKMYDLPPIIKWKTSKDTEQIKNALIVNKRAIFICNDEIHALNTQDGKLLWSYGIDDYAKNNLTINNGKIYLYFHNYVDILNAKNGKWTGGLSVNNYTDRYNPNLVIKDSIIYIIENTTKIKHYIYKLDERKSTIISKTKIKSDYIITGLNIKDGIAYIISDNEIYAYDIKDFKLLWKADSDIKPLIAGNYIYTGIIDGNISNYRCTIKALDKKTGKFKWEEKFYLLDGFTSMTSKNGLLYIIYSSNVRTLDMSTGKLVWEFKTNGHIGKYAIVKNNKIFLVSEDYYLYVLNAREGTMIWRFKRGGDVSSVPTVTDNILYIDSDDGFVNAIDIKSGILIWKFMIGEDAKITADKNTLYIGSSNGDFYALKENN